MCCMPNVSHGSCEARKYAHVPLTGQVAVVLKKQALWGVLGFLISGKHIVVKVICDESQHLMQLLRVLLESALASLCYSGRVKGLTYFCAISFLCSFTRTLVSANDIDLRNFGSLLIRAL
jgi:hypothetical protein